MPTAAGRAFAQRRAPVEPVIPDETYCDGVAEDGGFQFRRTNMKGSRRASAASS